MQAVELAEAKNGERVEQLLEGDFIVTVESNLCYKFLNLVKRDLTTVGSENLKEINEYIKKWNCLSYLVNSIAASIISE